MRYPLSAYHRGKYHRENEKGFFFPLDRAMLEQTPREKIGSHDPTQDLYF